jgi:hypothetical protein
MKLLIPLLIVSTSALAATTVQYAQRAGVERKRADEALVASQKQETRIRELETSYRTLEHQLMETQRPASLPPPTASTSAPSRNSTPPARPVPAPLPARAVGKAMYGVFSNTDPAVSRGFSFVNGGSPWANASPAAQRYMKLQHKMMMRKQYEDVGPALGLSQEQTGKLMDVLADQMVRDMTQPRKALNDMTSMRKAAEEAKARQDAEIASVLGQDKARQWQDYQRTLPQRSQVNMIGEQMEMLGEPLTSYQRSQLLTVMLDNNETPAYPTYDNGLSHEERRAQAMKWQDDQERTLLERVKPVLTSQQLEMYRDYQAYQKEMRDNMMRSLPPPSDISAGEVAVSEPANTIILRRSAEFVPAR